MLLNKNFRIIFEVSIFLMRFVSCKNKGYKDIPNGRSNVVVSRMARVEAVVPTLEQYLIDPTKDYGPAHKDNGPFRLSSSVDLKLPGIIVRDVSYEKGEDQDEVSRVKSPTNVNGRVHSGLVPPLRGSDVLQNLEASLAREAVGRDYHRVVRRASESNKYPIETPIKAKIQPIVSKLYDRSKVSKSSEKIKGVVRSTTIFTQITWYSGEGLLNPYCVRGSSWTPTDSSLVIAVTKRWKSRPACGEFFEISVVGKRQPLQLGDSVIARVVDLCGGCEAEVPQADLSKAAFLRLFDLDAGLVSGLQMTRVSPPQDWDENLYGPKVL